MKRAIHPGDLITWTLPRLGGYGRALKWLYPPEDIPLAEAHEAGLVDQVCPADAVLETAHSPPRTSRKGCGPSEKTGVHASGESNPSPATFADQLLKSRFEFSAGHDTAVLALVLLAMRRQNHTRFVSIGLNGFRGSFH